MPVVEVEDVTHLPTVDRDLALIRVRCGPGERSEIAELIEIFRGRIVDVAAGSVMVEVTGDEQKVDGLVALLQTEGDPRDGANRKGVDGARHAAVGRRTCDGRRRRVMTTGVAVFDTTLRDGEQSPGCSMIPTEKLRLARQLERLGVDVIEAGFPVASQGEWDAVKSVADEVRGCGVAALARCREQDITAAARALEGGARPRIHVFIATSAIHLKHKLGITEDEALRQAVEGVRLARSACAEVEFSAEDASRTDPVVPRRGDEGDARGRRPDPERAGHGGLCRCRTSSRT